MQTPMRLLGLVLACAAGCATIEKGKTADGDGAAPAREESRITYSQASGRLGMAVRRMGEESGASVVLMYGAEDLPLGAVDLKRVPFDKAIRQFADATQCGVQTTPYYRFLFPTGYESLQTIAVSGPLAPPYDAIAGPMAFGAGTHLFNVFNWISEGFDVTVIGDDAISSTTCGEVALGDTPLQYGLEAVLKSAGVVDFTIDSTGEYLFVEAGYRTGERDFLLNEAPLDPAQQAWLDREITLYLPEPPEASGRIPYYSGAQPLDQVLDSLSRQLGVRIVAESGLADLPVNPCTMNGVRVQTALNLLVRRWLVPEFGYQVTHDRIVIRRR